MQKNIVIIGAGAAGISAATMLMENGFLNVTVLEAENRIGGRINTIPFGENVLDMGAQWCHGEEDNVVFELARNHNLLEPNVFRYERFSFYQSNGTEIPTETTDKLCDLFFDIQEDYPAEMDAYKGGFGSYVIEKYNEAVKTPKYKDIQPALAQQVIDFLHKYENSHEASDSWFDTSCATLNQYWYCKGNSLLNWRDRGYRTLFDLLTRKVSDKDTIPIEKKVQYNKTVTKVKWSNSDAAISVECEDGSAYQAEHVITTVSLGVLKEKHLAIFEPKLPAWKIEAIEGLSFGTVDKVYVEFARPFWPQDWMGFSLLWNRDELEKVRRSSMSWLEDLFGFYRVDCQPNVLCGWISGANARRMEMSSDAEIRDGVMLLFKLFLKKWAVPEPKTVRMSKWYTNPNFRGSYSFRSIETDIVKTSAAKLAAPLLRPSGQPMLQFAGEATNDHYYSTVHGAVETGWREAKRIIDLFKRDIGDMKIKNPNGRSVKDGTDTIDHPSNVVDVLILGAGLAGLGAAIKLQQSGLKFLLLEGQSKAGGRVNTMQMLNHSNASADTTATKSSQTIIDCGAQWLHGKYNYLHDLAERHNLLISEQSEEGLGTYLRDDGFRFDDFFVKKIDFAIGQILEDCEKYARENVDDHYPKSVNSFLMENFARVLDAIECGEKRELAKQLLDWHVRFQVIDNSCLTLDHVSARSWGKYSYNGESCQAHYNFRHGFSSAANALVQELGVDSFLFRKEIVEIMANPSEPRISVKCSDDSVYMANHVIVTFSLGILKENLDRMFRPALPKRVRQTIRDIGFETINKLFLQFDEPWWGDMDGIQLVFKNANYKDQIWTRHISGFDVMRPGPSNTLLAWVGGAGAIEMEQLTDNQIIKDCIDLLAQFTNLKVPAPIHYYCTRWHTNRFIRGAYSYISTDCDKNGTSSQLLAEPITLKDWRTDDKDFTIQFAHELINIQTLTLNDTNEINNFTKTNHTSVAAKQIVDLELPLLLFAGEACHEKYFSTAHGAFLSGMEQAGKILEFYNKLFHF